MSYIAGFKVERCPRYLTEEAEGRVAENHLVQGAFWSAVRLLLVGDHRTAVELRFASNPVDRSVTAALMLLDEGGPAPVELFERMLPPDYRWSRLGVEGGRVTGAYGWPQSGAWHVARLVRRVEFFNVPDAPRWLLQRDGGGPGGRTDALPGEADLSGLRALPWFSADRSRQQRFGTLCVPLLQGIAAPTPDRRRFCLEMQHAAPAILSIVLRPADEAHLPGDRARANFLRRWLDPFRTDLQGSDAEAVRALLPNFDRYWLPGGQLCSVTIRTAALTAVGAQAVAHHLAAQLGGSSAFEVLTLGKPLEGLEGFLAWGDKAHRDRLPEWLRSVSVSPDEAYADFLRRMPHLYTLDEAERVLRLPFSLGDGSVPGMATGQESPFHASSPRFEPVCDSGRPAAPPAGRLRLGVADGASNAVTDGPHSWDRGQWHTLAADDLTKHALIVGSTGSGKTVATTLLIQELARLRTGFLIVEPVKTEYYGALAERVPGLCRRRFEGDAAGRTGRDFLAFDPMRLQRGVTVARHLSHLRSCFCAAFPLDEVQSLILDNGLRAFYTSPPAQGGCGLSLFTRGGQACHSIRPGPGGESLVYPGWRAFIRFMANYLERELNPRRLDQPPDFVWSMQQAFRRRFESLDAGVLGTACRLADDAMRARAEFWDPFHTLLNRPTIVELDAIADNDQKALVMALLLTFLYERRQADDLLRRESGAADPGGLKHVLVVEEAHRLLANPAARSSELAGESARARAVGLFVDMLAEVRAYGQGLVIVEQIPTKIVPEAIKNTNLKVMLRMSSKEDREYLGEAMNLNPIQKRFVTGLQPGQCVVFEECVEEPLHLTVPHPRDWGRLGIDGTSEKGVG